MQKNVWMIITIDSVAKPSTTEERRDILASHGFSEFSPHKSIRLPESTYIGFVPYSKAGKAKVDEIWEDLKSADLEPKRIFGGTIKDWKVLRSQDDED